MAYWSRDLGRSDQIVIARACGPIPTAGIAESSLLGASVTACPNGLLALDARAARTGALGLSHATIASPFGPIAESKVPSDFKVPIVTPVPNGRPGARRATTRLSVARS